MSMPLDSMLITSNGDASNESNPCTNEGMPSILNTSIRSNGQVLDNSMEASDRPQKDADHTADISNLHQSTKSINTTPTKIPTAAMKNRLLGIPPKSNTYKQLGPSNKKQIITQTPATRLNGLKSTAATTNGKTTANSMRSSNIADGFTTTSRTLSTIKPCTNNKVPVYNIVNNPKTPKSSVTLSNNNSVSVKNRNSIFKAPNSIMITKEENNNLVHKTVHKQPTSKITTPIMPIKSRSSSIVSSISSTTTKTATPKTTTDIHSVAPIPSTQRKGLAKFANPIECQRQFQTLSLKIRKLNEIVEAREKEQDTLQEKFDRVCMIGTGYAVIVQYFGKKLKLDEPVNLLQECENLKSKMNELLVRDSQAKDRENAIVDDFEMKLKKSNDLKDQIQHELDLTIKAHSERLDEIITSHRKEIDDLNSDHQIVKERMDSRILELESDLNSKTSELSNLRQDYSNLKHDYDTLEDSLTKDKDSRMKYAQERITQLQKDVESLTTVLEMRQERLHQLEKDNVGYIECQDELKAHKEVIKSLNQQLESINAALDKKRDQYKKLLCENERIKQELELENKERRRIIMRTEQLEYVLNESCTSDTATNFNSSVGNSSVMLSSSPRSQTFEAS